MGLLNKPSRRFRENGNEEEGHIEPQQEEKIETLFKKGDDLRKDQVVLQ